MSTRLDGKTWLRYSISIWDDIEKSPEERALTHPALYPAALIRRLIETYFSSERGWVFDPFLGSGSTLVGARDMGLSGIGIEIVPAFAETAYKRLADQATLIHEADVHLIHDSPIEQRFLSKDSGRFAIIIADARNTAALLPPNSMDMLITSPPYWHIHTRRRTADRKERRPYSDIDNDLGNIETYEAFLAELSKVFEAASMVLKPKAVAVVNVMDIRVGGSFIPYHMHITELMETAGFALRDIIIWDRRREYNNLRPLGYPHRFIINKIHEYLLVFDLDKNGDEA